MSSAAMQSGEWMEDACNYSGADLLEEPSELLLADRLLEATEDELIVLAQDGVTSALDELLRRNRKYIYAVVRRYTDSVDDADDIVQETMLRAIRNFQRFRREASLATWLTRIAVNVVLSEKRRTRNVRWVSIDGEGEGESPVSSPFLVERRPDPEQSYLRKELRCIVSQKIARILPECRRTLLACYLNETPLKVAAEQLGIPEGTAKSHLRRARLELARAVKPRLARAALRRAEPIVFPKSIEGENR